MIRVLNGPLDGQTVSFAGDYPTEIHFPVPVYPITPDAEHVVLKFARYVLQEYPTRGGVNPHAYQYIGNTDEIDVKIDREITEDVSSEVTSIGRSRSRRSSKS